MILTQTAPSTKTHVQYDRSAKSWMAVNGTVTPTGNGPDGKRAALLLALEHDHPQLFARVTQIAASHNDAPGLVDRLIRAAGLIAKGHVRGDRVISQTTGEAYQVTFGGIPKQWSCDCQDFAYGGVDTEYGQKMCKHCLAALLDYLTS
jgi:hypothetical protein